MEPFWRGTLAVVTAQLSCRAGRTDTSQLSWGAEAGSAHWTAALPDQRAILQASTTRGKPAPAQVAPIAVKSPIAGCCKPRPGCRHWFKPAPRPGLLHLCPCGRAECAAVEGAHHRCGHTAALQSGICVSCCLAAATLELCAALQAQQTRHTAMAALSSTCEYSKCGGLEGAVLLCLACCA